MSFHVQVLLQYEAHVSQPLYNSRQNPLTGMFINFHIKLTEYTNFLSLLNETWTKPGAYLCIYDVKTKANARSDLKLYLHLTIFELYIQELLE